MKEIVTLDYARENGLLRYFTGKPCKNGHVAERYTKKSTCVDCDSARRQTEEGKAKKKAYQDEYYAKHRETFIAKSSEWYAANKERVLQHQKEFRKANPELMREKDKAKYWSNVEYERETQRRRAKENPQLYRWLGLKNNAKQRFLVPAWDGELREFVEKEAIALAVEREKLTPYKWQVDHIYPAKGKTVCGLHVWNNLQVVPATVNHHKSFNVELTEPGDWLRDERFWNV